MIAGMGDLLSGLTGEPRVLCGFSVFGYEDALAATAAGDEVGAPILLMVNRAMAEFMPPESCAPMLRELAERYATPVGVHLDHCRDFGVLERALDSGFTSAMYDASERPLEENIRLTYRARKLADRYGVALEGEVGTVPYSDLGETQAGLTDPEEAERFAQGTGVDALAVSVGNIHRLTEPTSRIDFDRLAEIEERVSTPLVIHGASGLREEDVDRLLKSRVAKLNIGTRLRKAFGSGLRTYLADHPDDFDRLRILASTVPHVREATRWSLVRMGWGKDAR